LLYRDKMQSNYCLSIKHLEIYLTIVCRIKITVHLKQENLLF